MNTGSTATSAVRWTGLCMHEQPLNRRFSLHVSAPWHGLMFIAALRSLS